MPFSYVASTRDGKIVRGYSALTSREAVLEELASKDLIVVSVTESRWVMAVQRAVMYFFGTVKHTDRVMMTKHLSVMLKAGLTLLESLRILEEQAGTWRLRNILHKLVDGVERGTPMSDAMEKYPRVFSAFYINIIRAGESSGTLEENLEHLAVQLSKEHEIGNRVRSALVYPIIVMIAAAVIGFFFSIYVIPQIAHLFAGLSGIKLPWVTVVMLNMANFTKKYTVGTFFGLFGGGAFLFWFIRRRFLAPVTHWVNLRLWVVGPIIRNVNLARFALVLGTQLKSGIPITQAVKVTGDVLENYYYKKELARIIAVVEQGGAVSEAMISSPRLFPKIASRMINIGERSGKLEEVLQYLADFYDLEVQTATKNLTTLLEPLLLIIIGLITAGLAYAIIIPIYNFISAIGKI
jgi:type IV pilus assembly protein PilC